MVIPETVKREPPSLAEVRRQARNDALDEAIDICNQEATVEGIAQKCAARISALKSREPK